MSNCSSLFIASISSCSATNASCSDFTASFLEAKSSSSHFSALSFFASLASSSEQPDSLSDNDFESASSLSRSLEHSSSFDETSCIRRSISASRNLIDSSFLQHSDSLSINPCILMFASSNCLAQICSRSDTASAALENSSSNCEHASSLRAISSSISLHSCSREDSFFAVSSNSCIFASHNRSLSSMTLEALSMPRSRFRHSCSLADIAFLRLARSFSFSVKFLFVSTMVLKVSLISSSRLEHSSSLIATAFSCASTCFSLFEHKFSLVDSDSIRDSIRASISAQEFSRATIDCSCSFKEFDNSVNFPSSLFNRAAVSDWVDCIRSRLLWTNLICHFSSESCCIIFCASVSFSRNVFIASSRSLNKRWESNWIFLFRESNDARSFLKLARSCSSCSLSFSRYLANSSYRSVCLLISASREWHFSAVSAASLVTLSKFSFDSFKSFTAFSRSLSTLAKAFRSSSNLRDNSSISWRISLYLLSFSSFSASAN
mmetsp:Transcript_24392/g.50657  ORF Transcript_24392/g.50657 Transcript_24392/m.50657 type:complete len:491 (+) Transcript_24392:714-2186(+)